MTRHTVPVGPCSEWKSACEVQRRFMRHSPPAIDALDYGAQCRQVYALGGNFYDFVSLANDRLAIAVGDASGKGLAAALMIANVQSSLWRASLFARDNGPAALDAVNRQVYGSSLADRYATLFFGVFDSGKRTLRYVNAGHNPPMVIRRDKSILWLETGSAPVGMFPDWKYEEGIAALHPGDMVLAYTDGVIEAINPDGEEWGLEGLRRTAAECGARCADEVVNAIVRTMDEYKDGLCCTWSST